MSDRIERNGMVAMKHYNSNQSRAIVEVDGKTVGDYSFIPQYNVSLCWVKPEHVDNLLGAMAQICCGRTAHKFLLANLNDVSIWETGHLP